MGITLASRSNVRGLDLWTKHTEKAAILPKETGGVARHSHVVTEEPGIGGPKPAQKNELERDILSDQKVRTCFPRLSWFGTASAFNLPQLGGTMWLGGW